ncbi:MAG: isochorismatase family protein [Planctomycetes bacterium]|nr:isochorismatase family protein [Planctomycetota bacterium]
MAKIDQACLVVVDIQGKLAQMMCEKEALFAQTEILLEAFAELNMPILWCQQVPEALGPTIESIQALLSGQHPIDKACFSAWKNSDFKTRLINSDRSQVVLCGIEAHICIYQTARDLLENGFQVEIVAEAVSSRTPENKAIGLNRIQKMGGQVTSVEMLLFDLLKTAEHPSFKALAKLIR